MAILTSSMASSPASFSGQAATHRPLLVQAPTQAIVSAGAVSPTASRRKPSVADLPSAARRPMWSTMGHAAKQAPQAVHRAASSGPASARKASVVSARAAGSFVIGAR